MCIRDRLDADDAVLASFGDKLSTHALHELEALGVEVQLSARVVEIHVGHGWSSWGMHGVAWRAHPYASPEPPTARVVCGGAASTCSSRCRPVRATTC